MLKLLVLGRLEESGRRLLPLAPEKRERERGTVASADIKVRQSIVNDKMWKSQRQNCEDSLYPSFSLLLS
jgi:hypothetical protein